MRCSGSSSWSSAFDAVWDCGGSVSQPVTTYAPIIAGSVFSCAIPHMFFIWLCDCLMSKWPRLRLTKYVDDLTISCRGRNRTVATVITEAVSSMVGWLENGLGRRGGQVTSSTKALGMRSSRTRRVRSGSGQAAQNATCTADQNQEEDAQGSVLQEVWRGHQQGRQGGALAERLAWRKVHGHAADEAESPQDHGWMMLARQTRGTFSPLASGHARVLADTRVYKVWRRQQRLVGLKPSWSKVSGPMGAIIMCLRQLGWTWPHHTTFVTASGHEVDVRQICTRDVKAQATRIGENGPTTTNGRSCSRALCWNLWYWQTNEPTAIKAALGVIRSGWGTQEVANKAGIAEHPFCLYCGPAVLGSAQHRLWACPAYRETRMHLPPTHQHQGQTATGDKLKMERGLMHDPVEKYTPGRTHDGTIHVWIRPSVVGNSFGGKMFVDASLTCKHGSQGGEAGWAVAQIHETTHELVSSAHGAIPISFPVQRRILRAELWALWQAIILSESGATFVSDCATVLRGLERGSKWCTAARRPHADVCRRIWDCFRDIGRRSPH